MSRTKIIAFIRKCTFIFLTVFAALYVLDAYVTNYGNPWPDLLDPKSIGMPIYPYATNMCSWPKEKKPESDLSVGRTHNSTYPDYYFEYDVPGTGADPILKFYSDELTKKGWKIKEKPETTCDYEYQVRYYHVIYTKYTKKLSLWIYVYNSKPKNIYWFFKKSVPTNVRISVYNS